MGQAEAYSVDAGEFSVFKLDKLADYRKIRFIFSFIPCSKFIVVENTQFVNIFQTSATDMEESSHNVGDSLERCRKARERCQQQRCAIAAGTYKIQLAFV